RGADLAACTTRPLAGRTGAATRRRQSGARDRRVSEDARRIEGYAVIGDGETMALVERGGSIDWLCWPRFDSAACFAALLGKPEHGRWRIAPVGVERAVRRRYRGDSLIVETDFETSEGAATLVDFMPARTEHCNLVRMVLGRRG